MKKLLFTLLTGIITLTAAAQIPNYVPTNGLVGWWPFNGNANDESGNGNNGTVNGATLTADRFGNANNAYSFDGSNVLIPLTQQLVNMPSRTISVWFNSSNPQSGGRIFEATNVFWGIGCYSNNQFDCWFQHSNKAYNATNLTFNNHNEWYNLVYICDSSTNDVKVLLNGTNIHSSTAVINPGIAGPWQNNFIKIGQGNANESFNGKIDDIGIWNRALTNCEITDLYASQLGSLNSSSNESQIACSSYIWNGSTYNQSGQYTYTTNNASGCDSTAVLNLTINNTSSSTQTQTALDSYIWPVNGQTYTQSGQYTDTLLNAAGCDSIVTLDLTLSFTGIDELNPTATKKLLKITDLNGKEIPFRKNTVLLFIYEDGMVERIFEGE